MSFSAPINAVGSAISQGAGFGVSSGESAIGIFPPAGTSGKGIPTGRANIIATAASNYNVPIDILAGVFGMETAFGSNIRTSSAGAIGPFQFLPSTAKQYGYPLTNNPTAAEFQQQADAAAHYLSDLFHQTGSWETALQHYSGGGYGLSQVQAKAQQAPSWLQSIIGATGFTSSNPFGQTAQAAGTTAGALGQIASLLTSSAFWIRLGEAIAGVILIAMGLRSLTGSSTTPVSVAASAAKVAKHV